MDRPVGYSNSPHNHRTPRQTELEQATGEAIESLIRQALRRTGEKRLACDALGGIARTTLDRWVAQYGIDVDAEIALGKLQARGILGEVA